ncbi:hypothetical protein ACET3X_005258 [Alternaria dauci]|uniref:histidine kinase n=1 Tax=Alternaria dauci TaxID=48095 RepID=A0ABR3UJS4_9PLEO
MPLSQLSEQQRAIITDRTRIWEVRRFCQVLPSVVKYIRGSEAGLTNTPSERHGRYIKDEPDGALTAMLRCLIHQTGADLAMVSLLDDHTQYFISGASQATANDANITLDSTKWYGCESVTHHGGLCERTITCRNQPGNMAIYEELDMAASERTKDLPFVKGDIAKFRHYVGVPLNPYDGPNIGTVFIFSSTPSKNGLSAAHRSYLCGTASHIIRHLEQAVEALEGKRLLKFNQGVASLLRMGSSAGLAAESTREQPLSESRKGQQSMVSNLYKDSALRLYQLSATLLYDAFEFDGVRIQESGPSGNFVNRNPAWNGSSVLAEHLGPSAHKPQNLSHTLISRLVKLFPQGAVFQVLDEKSKIVAATSASEVTLFDDPVLSTELWESFPGAAQIVLMPLWDTFHERTTGAVLGFANTQARVCLSSIDLASISAFCTTIMTQVRRLEAQAMDKIKSDFLGSVSHEMRTPLHGILSSLELLADIPHNAHQNDLLETARYSGLSLLDTIERVLYFSNISSGSNIPKHAGSIAPSERLVHPSSLVHHKPADPPRDSDTIEAISLCEDIIHSESQRLRLKEAVQSQPSIGAKHPPIIVFDTNASWSCRLKAVSSFRAILTNLINNALKFGESVNCIRVSLNTTDDTISISCTDAGQGIASDFIRHLIFDSFSQEDPVTEGTGLGLSIVKQTVTMFGGDVQIESSKTQGSAFTVSLPSTQLLHRTLGDAAEYVDSQSGKAELPQLGISLFTPRRWKTGDAVRDQRRVGLLLDSLTQDLRRWFSITVIPWQSASIYPHSRLLFVLEEDENCAKLTYGGTYSNTERILLYPDIQTALSPYETPSKRIAAIAGPVTISKLQDALAHLFPDTVSPFKLRHQSDDAPATMKHQRQSRRRSQIQPSEEAADASNDVSTLKMSDLVLEREPQVDGEESAARPQSIPAVSHAGTSEQKVSGNPLEGPSLEQSIQTQTEQAEKPTWSMPLKALAAEPKMLLVDDNAVNLKVLTMYARKCSKTPATSVGGGQEAIDAFESAMEPTDGEAAQPFDLIFLDLSMPEVSGFDVARKIREMEARLRRDRTYICALTGLVSGKDRNAAYESGVDNYLVRPARLRDLQGIIEHWRDSSTQ